ncbi:MAG: FAD-dependent oxidoreductase [Pseudomonadota bacterium]
MGASLTKNSAKNIAIIGAGITGLTCARQLVNAGYSVTLLDKGRGIGGRVATRRADHLRFDHGAQFIKARTESFKNIIFDAEQAYTASAWSPYFLETKRSPENDTPTSEQDIMYVGMPSMSAFAKHLAEGLKVYTRTRVVDLQYKGSSWALILEDESNWSDFDLVIVTAPPVQAYELVSSFSSAFHDLQSAVMAPCWAGLFAFQHNPDIHFDAYRSKTGAISWACNNSSKPARDDSSYCWVVHASKEWTRSHLNLSKEEISDKLLKLFAHLCDKEDFGPLLHKDAHRWLYALVETPLGQPFIYDRNVQLAVAGDWCLGPRVEAAFESGTALANAIIADDD